MVTDGYYYALGFGAAAILLGWLAAPLWALPARRIAVNKQVTDRVERGERIGLIKFGSRVDVLLDASASLEVRIGDRVKGGASILAYLRPDSTQAVVGVSERAGEGIR